MSILITICARGGSKGIPGKNIKLLNGTPLIKYSIDVAYEFKSTHEDVDIALSTDSDEIIEVSNKYGLSTDYKRPNVLGGDNIGKIDVLRHILEWSESYNKKSYDYILDLDVTAPLRNLNDLNEAFKLLKLNDDAYNLFSVSPPHRNPYFNMVEQTPNGYYNLVKKSSKTTLTRQSAPQVYDLNASFYFYKKAFFQQKHVGAITDKSLVYVVPHMCFDLDHPIDYDFLSYLMANNKLGFDL